MSLEILIRRINVERVAIDFAFRASQWSNVRLLWMSLFLVPLFSAESVLPARYFQQSVFEYVLEVGESFRLDPETLVSDWGIQQGRFFWLPPRLPAWLKHISFNEFSGVPGHPDIGVHEVLLSLGRGGMIRESTLLRFRVIKRAPPPLDEFPAFPNPVELPDLILGGSFHFDLAQRLGLAEKEVEFSVRSGPLWLDITPQGVLKGTPRGAPGYFQATLVVSLPKRNRRTIVVFGEIISRPRLIVQ